MISMSGGQWSYNRFESYEQKLDEAKKAKKAAAETDSNPVKDKAPQAKGDDNQASDQANAREAASSAAVNVINVNDVAPASKKKGWWS